MPHGAWAGLSTNTARVASGAGPRTQTGKPPELLVSYRTPFTDHARLVAGTFSGAAVPPGAVGVAATTQTAARFGMHPGSRLTLATPSGPVTLVGHRDSCGSAIQARPSGSRTPR